MQNAKCKMQNAEAPGAQCERSVYAAASDRAQASQ
jgi:hypothetical protein